MRNQKFGHLELKSLSDITKEESDYIKKLKVICHSDGSHDLDKMQHTTDYLRSRGYIIPFMDLTIEQILAYKWAVYGIDNELNTVLNQIDIESELMQQRDIDDPLLSTKINYINQK